MRSDPRENRTVDCLVERDYPATWDRFTSLGPLLDKLGNGGKGISWNTQSEVDFLGKLNYVKPDGPAKGRPRIDSAIEPPKLFLASPRKPTARWR